MAKVSKFFENWRKMSPQPATVISNSFELQDGEGNIQVVCDNGGFQTDETQQRNVTNKLQERKKSRIGGRDLKQNLGEKLNRIKFIHDKRRQICDYAFALAMLGVALMIFEAEMLETRAYSLVTQVKRGFKVYH